ncbi:hypothetical protein PEC18_35610 [Paucibacter sp. O1-1]|nr:hypothetical protein [Paucibacter sp. O1-1]MDA3830990.1 hypothetical protein [Paucibacter sp. O1-1]
MLDRLAQYPDDTGAHLELTSLYYAQGDADKFEAAAQAMYAHIYDTDMPEWQQVKSMGRELAPHNPLFAPDQQAMAPSAPPPAFGAMHEPEPMRFDGFDDVSDFGKGAPAGAPRPIEDDNFDFDLTDRTIAPLSPVAPMSAAPVASPVVSREDDFALDLPPMDFDTRISNPTRAAPVETAPPRASTTI